MSQIYFVQIEHSGPIKIGFTSYLDPARRLYQLQAGCPWPLRLLGSIAGSKVRERALHELLDEYRMEREWFQSVPIVVRTVQQVLSPDFQWPHTSDLDRAIARAGSQCDLALAIGVAQSTISLARKNGISTELARRVSAFNEASA